MCVCREWRAVGALFSTVGRKVCTGVVYNPIRWVAGKRAAPPLICRTWAATSAGGAKNYYSGKKTATMVRVWTSVCF